MLRTAKRANLARFSSGCTRSVPLTMMCACVAARCDQARDLSTVSQNALKLWMTVDARVDVDGARVAQWNDISHGENHAKQNNAGKPMLSCFLFSLRQYVRREYGLIMCVLADKSPAFESTPDAGDMIVFGNNNAYLSTQPVQLFETADQGLTAFIMFKVRTPIVSSGGGGDSRWLQHLRQHQRGC
eukprot:COSAG02_NODE_2486_length_8709_cov_5.616725_1_plen_186_part_00